MENRDFNLLGYRFHPTEDEIITHFLENKMRGRAFPVRAINTLNICAFEPWQLPEKAALPDDEEWYFFNEHNKNDGRTTRAGQWKVTGKDRLIWDKDGKKVIGVKKILVFYKGRRSNATKTSWVIHEYHSNNASAYQKPYVLSHLRGNLNEKQEDYTQGASSRYATSDS